MAATAGAQAQTLTFERIFSEPSLTGEAPGRVSFDPKGERIVFLKASADDQNIKDLWVADVKTGESRALLRYGDVVKGAAVLSEAEKARRERQRIRGGGIVEYIWPADRSDILLVPVDGQLFIVRFAGDGEVIRQLTDQSSFETDAKLSPDGAYVSFVRDQSLYIQSVDSNTAIRFSPSGSETVSYGVAEFVAQEEMDRDTGYWWSPDGQWIAYTMVDEGPVTVVLRPEIAADGVTTIAQRYPRAGADNAIVRLFVAPVADPSTAREIDLGRDADVYLPRVTWASDSHAVIVQRQSRDQQQLDILRADVTTGKAESLWRETSTTWINLHDDLHALGGNAGFLWASEKSGYRHLYVRDASGDELRQVTSGAWQVDQIEAIDEARGLVFFSGRADGALEKHLYRISFQNPGVPERLTALGYWNETRVAPGGGSYLCLRSSPNQPPQFGLFDGDGALLRWIVENPLDETHPYAPYLRAHVTPEFGTIELPDGTALEYELLLPPGTAPVPAVLHVYGGPGVQMVRRDWGGMIDQLYVQNDVAVMKLDNRGAAGRGKAFEDPIYLKLGSVEVADQVRALEFLATHPRIKQDRIAVKGWSYGGYMTLKLLMSAADKLVAGVSGAPVTRWQLYDTHYTERFLGQPGSTQGPAVYEAANVFADIDGLEDPLLIIHGMADDNVLFDNATLLFEALQKRAIAFETMVYPGQKHGLRGQKIQQHSEQTTWRFLLRHLGD
ncbi:MAG: S9 family peptidase [Pseudomonadota bacterium]